MDDADRHDAKEALQRAQTYCVHAIVALEASGPLAKPRLRALNWMVTRAIAQLNDVKRLIGKG
jgi:hypothetical protein